MGDPIRVLIAEDNDELRSVVISLLDTETDLRCVADTGLLEEVVPLATATDAQLVILDIELNGKSSVASLPQFKRDLPKVRFLMHSGYGHPALIAGALAAGASGYVLKSGNADELVHAIRKCMISWPA